MGTKQLVRTKTLLALKNADPQKRRLTPAKQALQFAEQVRDDGANWTEAHNRLFGHGGKISQLFKTEAERAAFLKSPEYEQVNEIINALPQAAKPQPASEASGKILVRVPRTVHSALLKEAEAEGTSLNQLIVAKLCIGLQAASR